MFERSFRFDHKLEFTNVWRKKTTKKVLSFVSFPIEGEEERASKIKLLIVFIWNWKGIQIGLLNRGVSIRYMQIK